MAIKPLLIDILGRSIETCTASQNTLGALALALLPSVDLIHSYLGIEGDDGELSNLGQLVQLREEGGQHAIINRTRLINRDCDLGMATNTLAGVDLWEPLVDTARSAALVRAL